MIEKKDNEVECGTAGEYEESQNEEFSYCSTRSTGRIIFRQFEIELEKDDAKSALN